MTPEQQLNACLDRILEACEGDDAERELAADELVIATVRKVGDRVTAQGWLDMALNRLRQTRPTRNLAVQAWLVLSGNRQKLLAQITKCRESILATPELADAS